MPAQLKQLSTPTYQSSKERELKKMASDSLTSITPSSKSRSDDLKELDQKWCERFARLEAMLVSKTSTVPVNPVQYPPPPPPPPPFSGYQ